MLALLLACSTSTPSPPIEGQGDPCCSLALEGDPVWARCADAVVRRSMCHQHPACCTEQWGPTCVQGYREYAPSCPARRASNSTPELSDGNDQAEATPLGDPVELSVVVRMDPPPSELLGGTVFYGGFTSVESHTGRPSPGTQPADFGVLALRTKDFPLHEQVELVPGLHYFVVYGGGAFPEPGDRTSDTVRVEPGANEVTFEIRDRIIPN